MNNYLILKTGGNKTINYVARTEANCKIHYIFIWKGLERVSQVQEHLSIGNLNIFCSQYPEIEENVSCFLR